MAINKLYQYILNELDNLLSIEDIKKDKFLFKKNSSAVDYVFYELNSETKIITNYEKQYSLISHHISIYENQVDNDPYLSQYHYTAYFIDRENIKYQLHVYFNQNDQLCMNPIFSIQQNDEYKPITIDREFSQILSRVGTDETVSFISKVRKNYNHFLFNLVKSYEAIEQKLQTLSMTMEDSSAYVDALNEIIPLLNKLSKYHYDKQYESILRLFQKISLASPPTEQQTSPEDIHFEAEQQDIIIDHTFPKPKQKEPATNKICDTIRQATEARNSFLSKTGTSQKDLLALFNEFDLAVANAVALSLDGIPTTAKELHTIEMLLARRNSEGKKLLINLLLNNQFDLALSLKKFVDPIPDNLIKLALTQGKAALLDFLLTHGHYAVNTSLVDDLQPVIFCLHKDSQKSPKVECLSVLIKHHASLMLKDVTGLPVAHSILSETVHPLYSALVANSNLTIGNPHFFSDLIHQINDYLANRTLDETTRKKFECYISSYKYLQSTLIEGKLVISNENIKQNEIKLASFRNDRFSVIINTLREDNRFVAVMDQIYKGLEKLLAELPNDSKKAVTKYSDSSVDYMQKIFEVINIDNPKQIDVVLKKLSILASMLEKTTELMQYKNINLKNAKIVVERMKVLTSELKNLATEVNLDKLIKSLTSTNKENEQSFQKKTNHSTTHLLDSFGMLNSNTNRNDARHIDSNLTHTFLTKK